jgi:peptidoglycan/LPS O-acetylase OafA/YrhL
MLARRAATHDERRLAALAPAAALLVFGLSGKAAAAFAVPPAYPYGGYNTDWHSVLERSFWCQADLFAFGMALAVLRVDWEDDRLRLPRRWRAYAWTAVIALYLVTTATHRAEQLSYSPYNTAMALACALLLALVVLTREGERAPRLVQVLETRPLIAVGLASYSLFLWHEPITHFLNRHGMTLSGVPGLLFNLVLVGAAAGALSALTYRLVEAVALRRKASTRVRSEPALAVPDTAPELLAEPAV